MSKTLTVACSLGSVAAQQAGTATQEKHLSMPMHTCTNGGGCVPEDTTITLDANWRWTHNVEGYDNCFTGEWNRDYCPDGETCSRNCAIEGVDEAGWKDNYGTTLVDGGIQLMYTKNSRSYLMDSETTYKMFRLKNREFTVDVDASTLPCGTNGALYFVEMERDGGIASSHGLNNAGAKFGTGYCDAQCPRDIHFIGGHANTDGNYGSCCAEMDIWEANSMATAYTAHPCRIQGSQRVSCNGAVEGEADSEEAENVNIRVGDRRRRRRAPAANACDGGTCDQPGCDFNPYRENVKGFYGPGSSYSVDSTKPFTVVTQFLTHDGTDEGDLSEIRRFYIQDGQTIANPMSNFEGLPRFDSLKDGTCSAQHHFFPDDARQENAFSHMGGLRAMGEALDRGMVLAFSIWDDGFKHMQWLDGVDGTDPNSPGATRGPCPADSGRPDQTRQENPNAYVKYMNVKVGEIGSTTDQMPETKFSCSECESHGYGADQCDCGYCGSYGGCGFTCGKSSSIAPLGPQCNVATPPAPPPAPTPVPPAPTPSSGCCSWSAANQLQVCGDTTPWCAANAQQCEVCGGHWANGAQPSPAPAPAPAPVPPPPPPPSAGCCSWAAQNQQQVCGETTEWCAANAQQCETCGGHWLPGMEEVAV